MKFLKIITLFVFTATFLGSCKKEAASPKDYLASIKNKTWSGTLTNAGEMPQYYSVHFNAGNSLLWSQLSGDYAGTWSVAANKLTVTFNSPAVVVTAEISNDNTLSNITTTTANKVNSGELIANPTFELINTVWKGSVLNGTVSQNLQLSFLANEKAEIKLGTTTYPLFIYEKCVSGNAYRIHTGGAAQYFVVVFDHEMKGSATDPQFPFRLDKQ